MPPPAAPGDEDEIAGAASRLDTLLPLVRNTLLIGLAVVAIIVALATLGLNIGPLLAGLGVVGIAVGFGAQSLVRDVISGLFFLMEDAFRVGEYIEPAGCAGPSKGCHCARCGCATRTARCTPSRSGRSRRSPISAVTCR